VTLDLVIQDLRLPDMHGIDLAGHIRDLYDIEELPVIAVSGVSTTLESANNVETLFTDFILKPVDAARLVDLVRAYLPLEGEQSLLPGERRLILVADDDALQRPVTASRFRRQGFRVREAADGEQALDQALVETPAAIVSDVLMPRMDGVRLCQTVRATPLLAAVPVVLVSSSAVGPEDSRMALSAGADGCVRRSTSCEEVIARVLAILDAPETVEDSPSVSDLSVTRTDLASTDGDTRDVDSSDYRARLIRQLERQAQITSELTRISNLRAAQLSVLAGVSETLTRTLDLHAALEEALARCMDVSVFSLGAAFLVEGDDLVLTASHGFPEAVLPQLEDFFGFSQLLHRALDEQEIVTIPSTIPGLKRADKLLVTIGAKGLQVVPLIQGDSRLGALVLASLQPDIRKRGFAFARTIQGQLTQALQLGRAMDRLAVSEQRFRRVAEAVAEGLLISGRDGRITFMNEAAQWLFGVAEGASLTLEELMPGIDVSAADWEGSARARGSATIVRVSTSLTVVGHELERTHLVQDVTDARATEAELRALAEHDDLTGLLNRRGLRERLGEELAGGGTGTILFIDLDGFKSVNDRHGHHAGDFVLARLADVVQERLGERGLLARIGGDEFALLWPDATEADARELSERVRSWIVGLQIAIDAKPVTLDASVGAVVFPEHGDTAETLVERADAAMYRAKREGGGRLVLWTPDPPPGE